MQPLEVFERFVPKTAANYCCELYDKLDFTFKITKKRQTKLGDYRYDPRRKTHTITVNNDLNKYAFLVTYIHEVAHLITYQKFQRSVAPHGNEWKNHFTQLIDPLLTEKVFPADVLKALIKYFKNPKASSCSDPDLYLILRKYDSDTNSTQKTLKDIPVGACFSFNNRAFRKIEKKRTRSVCTELETGRKYLISEIAPISPIQKKA